MREEGEREGVVGLEGTGPNVRLVAVGCGQGGEEGIGVAGGQDAGTLARWAGGAAGGSGSGEGRRAAGARDEGVDELGGRESTGSPAPGGVSPGREEGTGVAQREW